MIDQGFTGAGEVNRRRFLQGLGAGLPLAYAALGGRAWGADQKTPEMRDGLIVRQKNPDNFEFPFQTLDSFLTPNEKFFVRNHFPQPKIDPRSWKLTVEGAVNQKLTLTLADIKKLPTRTVTATLECSGNGRSFLVPKSKGVLWALGAVSNAEWTGVPLAAVLERAGLHGARAVVLEGTDRGEITAEAHPTGTVHFARSLPILEARKPEVLLAYRMNGQELPAAHGFPLRAIVPGWYGVASIKWLQRLVVSDRPAETYFQTFDYSIFDVDRGVPRVVPVTELQVKAQIARPHAGEEVPAGKEYQVRGAAWTGGAEITKVEVSTDGGKNWSAARLTGKKEPFAWRLWEYPWRVPAAPGKVTLLARATDSRGHVQPLKRDPNRRNYLITHSIPTEVTVK